MRWTVFMLGCVLSASLFAQESSAPSAPNRSGDAVLKKVLKTMGSLRKTRLTVDVESRSEEKEPFFGGNKYQIQLESLRRYRIEVSSYWGDGAVYASDGATLLKDPLDMGSGVTLRTAKDTPWDTADELAIKGDHALVTLYLLGGEISLDKLAPKEAEVTADGNVITITKSPFGTLRLYLTSDKNFRVRSLDYDNWAAKTALSELYPDWIDPPIKGTLDREWIDYSPQHPARKNPFDTKPPKGIPVSDLRKSESKPPTNG